MFLSAPESPHPPSEYMCEGVVVLTLPAGGSANNQWKLELDVGLEQTSFRKALEKAEGTVSVLDKRGKTYDRAWCCYEIYVSLVDRKELKYEV